MEIVATFPIQLYISIYSTLRFKFSKAYAMIWTDCSSILFEVIDTHSLSSCTASYRLSWWVWVRCFGLFSSSGGTVTNVQVWISMTYGDFIPLIYKDFWLECTLLPSVIVACIPNNIFIFFFIQRYDNEDLPYVKVRHDHLYTYAFTILYVYCDMQRMTQ